MFQRNFSVTAIQRAFSSAKIVLNAKGVECPDEIWINSSRIATLDASNMSGAFSRYEIQLPLSVLNVGPGNLFRFVGIACRAGLGGTDVDDFEFSNAQILFQ